MGCDSQFDDLYDRQREQELRRATQIRNLEATGYTVAEKQQAYSGPFIHLACSAIVSDMDVHDWACTVKGRSDVLYTPRHRA